MMGLLILTYFRGCINCFCGVIRDVTVIEGEFDTYDTWDKSATLTTLTMMRMLHCRSDEF
jgi:hypothetical protein